MSNDVRIFDGHPYVAPNEMRAGWQAFALREAYVLNEADVEWPGEPHVKVHYNTGSLRCMIVQQLIRLEGPSLALLWSRSAGLYFLVVREDKSFTALRFVAEAHTIGTVMRDAVFKQLRKKSGV